MTPVVAVRQAGQAVIATDALITFGDTRLGSRFEANEKIFKVEVASINTLNRTGKKQRTKFGIGKRKDTKRAIVTLKSGSIDIFTAVG